MFIQAYMFIIFFKDFPYTCLFRLHVYSERESTVIMNKH